jgi:hypothetical protein
MNWQWDIFKAAARLKDNGNDLSQRDDAAQFLADPEGYMRRQKNVPAAPVVNQPASAPITQPGIAPVAPSFNQELPPDQSQDALPEDATAPGIEQDEQATDPTEEKEDSAAVQANNRWSGEFSELMQDALRAFPQLSHNKLPNGSSMVGGIEKALTDVKSTRGTAPNWIQWFSRDPGGQGKNALSGGYHLLPPELQVGQGEKTRQAILNDLSMTPEGQLPQSLEALKDAIISQEPDVLALFEHAARSNASTAGASGVTSGKDSNSSVEDQQSSETSDLVDSSLSVDVKDKLEQAANAYASSPGSQNIKSEFADILDRLAQSETVKRKQENDSKIYVDPSRSEYKTTKVDNADFTSAVKEAFKGDEIVSDVSQDIWKMFFDRYPDLLPEANGNAKGFLENSVDLGYSAGKGTQELTQNQQLGLQRFEQLSQSGDERIGEFFKERIKRALDSMMSYNSVELYDDLFAINDQMKDIAKVARQGALHEYLRKKKTGQVADTAVRRYFLIKHKFDAATKHIDQVLDKGNTVMKTVDEKNIDPDTGEPMETKTTITRIKGTNSKFKISIQRKDGKTINKEISREDLGKLSGSASPRDWVPGMIEDMRRRIPEALHRDMKGASPLKLEYKKANDEYQAGAGNDFDTRPIQKKMKMDENGAPTGEQLYPNDTPSARTQQKGDRDTDRLKGFRMHLAKKVGGLLQSSGITPEEVAAKAQTLRQDDKAEDNKVKNSKGRPAGANFFRDPSGFIQKILAGEATRYSTNDMDALARCIRRAGADKGVQVPGISLGSGNDSESFFADPPEFEALYDDDGTNLNNLLGTAPSDFLTQLVHKKRDAEWRGGKFASPTALQSFFDVMRLNSSANYETGNAQPFPKQAISMFNELTGGVPAGTPWTRDKFQEKLKGYEDRNPYDNKDAPRTHEDDGNKYRYEYHKDDDPENPGKKKMYRYPTEPDLTDQGIESGLMKGTPRPNKKVQKEKRPERDPTKVHKLYETLDKSTDPQERADAGRKLKELREQIAQLPREERDKFNSILFPHRKMYDENGNIIKEIFDPVTKKPRRASVLDEIIVALAEANRLVDLRNRLVRYASADYLSVRIQHLVEKAAYLLAA